MATPTFGGKRGENRWPSLEARAFSQISPNVNGCWDWLGDEKRRYGRVFIDGKRPSAQRYIYEWFMGSVPEGLELDHLCENKHCVNPTHLEPVTHAENVRRWFRAHAKPTCPHGHPWVRGSYRMQGVTKVCRVCEVARSRRRRAA